MPSRRATWASRSHRSPPIAWPAALSYVELQPRSCHDHRQYPGWGPIPGVLGLMRGFTGMSRFFLGWNNHPAPIKHQHRGDLLFCLIVLLIVELALPGGLAYFLLVSQAVVLESMKGRGGGSQPRAASTGISPPWIGDCDRRTPIILGFWSRRSSMFAPFLFIWFYQHKRTTDRIAVQRRLLWRAGCAPTPAERDLHAVLLRAARAQEGYDLELLARVLAAPKRDSVRDTLSDFGAMVGLSLPFVL